MIHATSRRLKFPKTSILFLCGCIWSTSTFAGVLESVKNRLTERKQESTYFDDYLRGKQESKRLDALYRLYSSQSDKQKPRVEPSLYGIYYTGVTKGSLEESYKGEGIGGSVYFNNFIVSSTKIPMPNIVLGVIGETRVQKGENYSSSSVNTYAPSFRLFAQNQQDMGLFVNYRYIDRKVFKKNFKTWRWEIGAKLYLLEILGLEGNIFLREASFLPGRKSAVASMEGNSIHCFLEIGILSLGIKVESQTFKNTKLDTTSDPATYSEKNVLLVLSGTI